MHVIGISEGEEIENRVKEILEVVIAKNVPKLVTDAKPQIQETWKMSCRINIKNLHLGISYSDCRNLKTERILKEPRAGEIDYLQRVSITLDFLSESKKEKSRMKY